MIPCCSMLEFLVAQNWERAAALGPRALRYPRPGIARGEAWSGTRISVLSASIKLAVMMAKGKELLSVGRSSDCFLLCRACLANRANCT